MPHISKIQTPASEQDTPLLSALLRAFSDEPGVWFDEYSISANVYYRLPDVKAAISFLRPRYGRGRYLDHAATKRLRTWLTSMVGREVDGARLCWRPWAEFHFRRGPA